MSVRRALAVLACWTLLVGAVVPPAAAMTVAGGPPPTGSIESGGITLPHEAASLRGAVAVQANNSTVRHRNPDRNAADGDISAVQSHLAGRMGTIIVDCSQALVAGGFDPCEGLNGSYGDALSKYVEVSRETDTDRDDRTAADLGRTRREGREYARTVRGFRETYEEYRETRENGNASGARRKARELRELADETERTGGNLTRSLGNVTRGGLDVSDASRAVNETTANVTRTVDGIESELFVDTDTTARTNGSTVSFLDPLVVTGRVTTANGTAVPGASVGVARSRSEGTGRVRATTRTNATGHYRLVYRPMTIPAGTLRFELRLLPDVESPYLSSNATVTTRIEQVGAELAVLSAPASAAYGDQVRVRVRVTAGRTAAEQMTVRGLPVTARVGSRRLGTDRTDGSGEATPGRRLPATVPPGERTLVVGFGGSDRAISPVNGSVALEVRETATAISATVRRTGNEGLAVEGRLTTADGRPLPERTVRIALEDRSLGTLRTGSGGSFEGRFAVPPSMRPEAGSADRTLRLAYDGSGENLASAETRLTVRLGAVVDSATDDSGPAAIVDPATDDSDLAASLVVLLLLAVVGAVFLGRRRGSGVVAADARDPDRDETSDGPGIATGATDRLEAVRAAMDAGDYDLVTTAGYRAVRRALADRVDAGPGATHWEFYGACAADGIDPARLDAVRDLTERFERVAFAPDEASRSVAAAALTDVEAVLGGRDGVTDTSADTAGDTDTAGTAAEPDTADTDTSTAGDRP